MTRAERAKEYFLSGKNCAQAVALAFSDLLELPEETVMAATLPLSGGLGRLKETCGCVSGGAVALGLLFSERSKGEIYALVREFGGKFRERNGSLNCGELLSRSAEGGPKKPPCAELVYGAAEIVEDIRIRESAQ